MLRKHEGVTVYHVQFSFLSYFRPKATENRKPRVTGLQNSAPPPLIITMQTVTSPNKKTHQRSQSDATGLFQTLRRSHSGSQNAHIFILYR